MFASFVNDALELKIRRKADFQGILDSSEFKAVSFVNPFSYGILSADPLLLSSVDVFFSDGALLCTFSNFRRKNKIDRVSFDFSSIADVVFTYVVTKGLSIALVGGSEDEIEQAVRYLEARYPSLDVCFYRDGYFDEREFLSVIECLDRSKADILVAGMGTPLQESFIVKVKECSQSVRQSFTCGGFFTQTAMSGDYYSPLIKKLGLRWLQRCVKHKHVRRRLIKDYPVFILSYLLNVRFFDFKG